MVSTNNYNDLEAFTIVFRIPKNVKTLLIRGSSSRKKRRLEEKGWDVIIIQPPTFPQLGSKIGFVGKNVGKENVWASNKFESNEGYKVLHSLITH